ncbi:MAG TPA: cellulase family glycosylhydrolase [Stellaceae bacterium]|nr:cellulase family glycosylhydrolase [Stellaceae bacterium]
MRYLSGAVALAAVALWGPVAPAQAPGNLTAVTAEGSTGVIIPLVGYGPPPLTFLLVTKPAHGAVLIAGANAAYTPQLGFSGTDSFRYLVVNAEGKFRAPITVTVTVEASAPISITPPAVQISNNQLVDGNGQRFLVKGLIVRPVIAPFYMDGDPFEYFGDAELAAAQAWHANTIRILTSQIALDRRSRSYSKQYVLSVANAAQAILDHGFLLIVGVNDEIGTGETIRHCLPVPATQRAWTTLLGLPFAQARYRHNVMLELFNEPVTAGDQHLGPSTYWWQIWQNGGRVDVYDVGEVEPCVGGRKVGMNALIAQIRNAGLTNVLIADGLSWAHFLNPLFPLDDPLGQLAYAAHPFLEKWPSFHLTGNPAEDYAVLDAAFGDMRTQDPIIATAVDGGASSGGTDQTQHCFSIAPQVMPVLLHYLRQGNMGAVGWAFDLPPHALTLDWNWNPTSYAGFRCPKGPVEGQGGPGRLLRGWFKR